MVRRPEAMELLIILLVQKVVHRSNITSLMVIHDIGPVVNIADE